MTTTRPWVHTGGPRGRQLLDSWVDLQLKRDIDLSSRCDALKLPLRQSSVVATASMDVIGAGISV